MKELLSIAVSMIFSLSLFISLPMKSMAFSANADVKKETLSPPSNLQSEAFIKKAYQMMQEVSKRAEVRNENFESNLRKVRKELSNYVRILNVVKLRNPEQGEQLWENLFVLRMEINAWTDVPSDSVGYGRYREVKDAVIKTLMDTAHEILDLDQWGSYDYPDWQKLASARRYVVKLRAIALKEITARQILEDEIDGLEDSLDFISGVNLEEVKEEYEFVYAQITSTLQNIVARISELEKQRSEIRKAA